MRTYHYDRYMSERSPSRPPNANDVQELVRSLARDSSAVLVGSHAKDRMLERDISLKMLFETLRTGFIRGVVKPGKYPDEWVCKMVKPLRGTREVGVVTVIIRSSRLRITTVEWEDLR